MLYLSVITGKTAYYDWLNSSDKSSLEEEQHIISIEIIFFFSLKSTSYISEILVSNEKIPIMTAQQQRQKLTQLQRQKQ